MAVISIGSLSNVEKASYVKEGLDFAKPHMMYAKFATGDRVAKRDGNTRTWFRFTKPSVTSGSSTTFSGGQTYYKNMTGAPPTFTPATPGTTQITAQVEFLFGQGHEWNDGMEYTAFADLPVELRELNAQHAAEAVETEIRDVLKVGTTVSYANAKASRGLLTGADQVDTYDFIDAVTVLRNNDAPLISGMYEALCSANIIAQLMKDSVFQTAVAQQKNYMFAGRIAELFGVGFDFSSLAPTVTNSGSNNAVATVEQTLIVGGKSYGITKWMMNDYDLVYTPPGGWGDEYAVRHALTWKHAFKSVILNQSWLLRLESAR